MTENVVIFAPNKSGTYALYSKDNGNTWRESAQIKNSDLDKDNVPKGDLSGFAPSKVASNPKGHFTNDEPKKTWEKYHRPIIGLDGNCTITDVYRVLDAYRTPDTLPQIEHAVKKGLCLGLRGHKSVEQDLIDIIESAENALQMYRQKKAIMERVGNA